MIYWLISSRLWNRLKRSEFISSRLKARKVSLEITGYLLTTDNSRPDFNGRFSNYCRLKSNITKIIVKVMSLSAVMSIARRTDSWTTLAPVTNTTDIFA
jgi:hypothetical protein